MQSKDIEIFLEIVKSRNISKAAEHMYISQSVLSTRLKKLEAELGFELFVRGKGLREIELTRQGKEFVSVANRWMNLFEEAELLREKSRHMLRLAAPETVYYDFLQPIVELLSEKRPDIRLSLQIADSSAVYEMMESNTIDYGFASYESPRDNIIHRYLYNQTYKLISYADFPSENGAVSPLVLDIDNEVEMSGGNFSSVALWRDKWFPKCGNTRIEVNSPFAIANILNRENSWSIMPERIANYMNDLFGLKVYDLTDAPEGRKIYMLLHEGYSGEATEAMLGFKNELGAYLNNLNNG